jgi:phenylpropionate dioxygenase-like ring-hydroxylating dioxygenase large terminal subunit
MGNDPGNRPTGSGHEFVQNAWYIVAWNREVGRNLLARRICDEPILLYRLTDGTPVALEDLCCSEN